MARPDADPYAKDLNRHVSVNDFCDEGEEPSCTLFRPCDDEGDASKPTGSASGRESTAGRPTSTAETEDGFADI